MKKVILLFCVVAGKFMVSGNPLTQILPALQTCPHTCNQNTYQNPNIYQNPNAYQNPNTCQNQNFQIPNQNNLNIPVVIQQPNPTQQILQQNAVPTILQQSSNNQLYPQQNTMQNLMAVAIPDSQISNPIVNQLSQIYMNKILSNPTIQTLMDQNMPFHLGQEYPQVYNGHNRNQNVGNTPNPTPTVVNNYFILPPELLNPEIEQSKPPKRNEEKRVREGPRRKSHDDFEGRRRPNYDGEYHPSAKQRQTINHDCPVHSKKEINRRPEPIIDEVEYIHSSEESERNVKRRNQNSRNNVREEKRGIPPEQKRHIHPEMARHRDMPMNHVVPRHHDMPHHREMPRHQETPRRREMPRHNEMPRHHEMSRHHGTGRHHDTPHPEKRPNLVIQIKEVPTFPHSSSENATDLQNPNNTTNQRRNQTKQSNDNEIVEEFKTKFPAIPEEVVRDLLAYLRRQIRKKQLGNPQLKLDATFPLRYDEIFPHDDVNDETNDRRRRPNRRQNKKEQTNVIETTTNEPSTSTMPTTTERTVIENSKDDVKISEKESTTDDREVTSKQQTETTTNSVYPELGTEDTVEDVSNGIIDDYFPDFSQDKSYYESGEYNIRNFRDNRYHYTTDRNYKPKEEIDAVLSKPFDRNIETTTSKYEIETEVKFQTPPFLESPDFITKQIIRQKPNSNSKNLSYKSSTYSDAKNPSKNDGKYHKIGNNKKTKHDNIQTMYAHSKVAKYGRINDDEEENVTPVVTYYLPDNMQYEDDGKTVIVAKRIPADHFW